MSADLIQAQYDNLEAIARRFARQAEATAQMQRQVERSMQSLKGGWQGKGSKAFFAEMDGKVKPVMGRLNRALQQAQQTTQEIRQILKAGEEQAAQPFLAKNEARLAAGQAASGGVLGFIGDLFSGAGAELGDMLTGIGNLILHPIDTAKGLWYGITHPGELWDALKKPYVEDWENGHPGRAIGRGIIFAGSLLLGTKGADKAAKAVGVAGKSAEIAEVAGKTGRLGEVAETAGKAGRLGEMGEGAGTAGKLGEVGETAGRAGKLGEASEGAGTAGRAAEGARGTSVVSREQRMVDLASDPAHMGKPPSPKTLQEARVGLELEEAGKLPGPITRDPSGAAEFIDRAGQKWDVKAFNSNFPPKKGGFSLERDVAKIEAEIAKGENVILDTASLNPQHLQQLQEAIKTKGLTDKILWHP